MRSRIRTNIVIYPTGSKIVEVCDQVLTSGLKYRRVPSTLYGSSRDMEPFPQQLGTVFESSG